MSIWKNVSALVASVILCGPALAQDDDGVMDARMREAERRLVEQEREMSEAARAMEARRAELQHSVRDENVAIEVRMREAEQALADAARQVAELSRHNLPRVVGFENVIRLGDRPALGISIGTGEGSDPVEGVTILGVSPGGAAEDAGLRSGDVITAINGESLTADNERHANGKLLDFMKGVEEGDELEVEYLRNGKTATVDLAPRPVPGGMYSFNFDGKDFTMPDVRVMPQPNGPGFRYRWLGSDTGLGDMELAPLTKQLGRYFGTDEGLLIVRAPHNEDLKLQDGDVILEIDGRKPTSVNHAMRILGSYQSGETVNIDIMRDKRKQKVSIDIPDDRQSLLAPQMPPNVHVVPDEKVMAVPGRRL